MRDVPQSCLAPHAADLDPLGCRSNSVRADLLQIKHQHGLRVVRLEVRRDERQRQLRRRGVVLIYLPLELVTTAAGSLLLSADHAATGLPAGAPLGVEDLDGRTHQPRHRMATNAISVRC